MEEDVEGKMKAEMSKQPRWVWILWLFAGVPFTFVIGAIVLLRLGFFG